MKFIFQCMLIILLPMVSQAQSTTGFSPLNGPAGSILPVTFHRFTASLEKNSITLNWSIDTDDIFSHYVVERSYDGKEYNDIGTVKTSGNADRSEVAHYTYRDAGIEASNGMVYYRLRWKEINQEVYYSPVRLVRISNSSQPNDLVTYPNPVKEQLRMTLPTNWQGEKVEAALYTSGGALILNGKMNAASQTEVLEMGKLAKGFYLLKLTCNGLESHQRIIKD